MGEKDERTRRETKEKGFPKKDEEKEYNQQSNADTLYIFGLRILLKPLQKVTLKLDP